MKLPIQQSLPTLFVIILSTGMIIYMTSFGIGLTPDSVVYLNTSHNMAAGNGFRVSTGPQQSEWSSHYPPLYPALWALAGVLGVSEQIFIRWLQIILALLFLILAAFIIRSFLPQKRSLQVIFLLIMGTSFPMLVIFSRAWSEGLFLCLGFFSLYLLAWQETKPNPKLWSLFALGFLFALTTLTRYAGLVFLAAAELYQLFWSSDAWKTKFQKSLLLATPTAISLGAWFWISYQKSGSTTNREVGFYTLSVDKLKSGIGTFLEWFLVGENTASFIKLIVLLLFFGLGWLTIRSMELPSFLRKTKPKNPPLVSLLYLFLLTYPAFILFSLLFLDANIPLNTRILSPLYVSILFAAAILLDQITRKERAYWVINALLALFMIGQLLDTLPKVQHDHHTGIGFNHESWRTSTVWKTMPSLLSTQTLVSNAPEPIYYYMNVSAIPLPRKFLKIAQSTNTLYESQINQLKTRTLKKGDLLVYFTHLNTSAFPSEAELLQSMPWELVAQTDLANMYEFNPQ